ncbi:MAG: dipeptidase [Solirubrobacterales bacterium]
MIIDGHADIVWRMWKTGEGIQVNQGHFDLERAAKAEIGLQIASAFVNEREPMIAFDQVLSQVEGFLAEIESLGDGVKLVRNRRDLPDSGQPAPIRLLLHVEGGDGLGRSMHRLSILYRLGVRSLGLTWNHRNAIADGILDADSGGGLTRFGREIIHAMNRLGMVVDLAHISRTAFFECLERSEAPAVVSHANADGFHPFPRNLTDAQLRGLAQTDGIVGISLVPDFIGEPPVGLNKAVDCIQYMVEVAGIEHVGLGSDFDGVDQAVLPDVAGYPMLLSALRAAGYTQDDINRLTHQNWLRVLKATLKD